jgi:hypothetical protein
VAVPTFWESDGGLVECFGIEGGYGRAFTCEGVSELGLPGFGFRGPFCGPCGNFIEF